MSSNNEFSDDKCNNRKSKTHPEAFTREQLIELAVNRLNITKTEARGYNKKQLCEILRDNKIHPQRAHKKDPQRTHYNNTNFNYDRECGPRYSRHKHPSAYTKYELVNLAITDLDMKKSEAKKLTIEQLCRRLKKGRNGKVTFNYDKVNRKKPCGIRKSKKNPKVYTKEQLISLAVRDLNMKKSEAKKYKVKDLCDLLFIPETVVETEEVPQELKIEEVPQELKIEEVPQELKIEEVPQELKIEEVPQELKIEEIHEQKSDIALEFNPDVCMNYSLEELQDFSKRLNLRSSKDKKKMCNNLIPAYFKELWTRCLNNDIDTVKMVADKNGISSNGNQQEICSRLLDYKLQTLDNNIHADNQEYINFINNYSENGEQAIINEINKNTISTSFLIKFQIMNDKERREFIKAYKYHKNPKYLLTNFMSYWMSGKKMPKDYYTENNYHKDPQRAHIEKEDKFIFDNDKYITFLNNYLKEKEIPVKDLSEISHEFLKAFEEMSDKDRKEFIKTYKFYNPDKLSILEFMEYWIKDEEIPEEYFKDYEEPVEWEAHEWQVKKDELENPQRVHIIEPDESEEHEWEEKKDELEESDEDPLRTHIIELEEKNPDSEQDDESIPKTHVTEYKLNKEEKNEEVKMIKSLYEEEKSYMKKLKFEEPKDEKEIQEWSKIPCIANSKIKLQPHQIRVVEFMNKHHGLLANWSTGSGKSLLAVTSVICVLTQHKDYKAVIVTPKSLVENMKKEFDKYGVDITKSPYKERIEFTTLDKFRNDYSDKYDKKTGRIIKNKKSCNNIYLVIDEAHNYKTIAQANEKFLKINNEKTKYQEPNRSYTAIECAKLAKKVLLLTATPVLNRPEEIANLMAMIRGEDPLTKHFFNKMYKNKRRGYDDQFDDYYRCKISMFRVSESSDYPVVVENNIKIEMDPEYYEKYLAVEREEIEKLENTIFKGQSGLQRFMNGMSAKSLTSPLERTAGGMPAVRSKTRIAIRCAYFLLSLVVQHGAATARKRCGMPANI